MRSTSKATTEPRTAAASELVAPVRSTMCLPDSTKFTGTTAGRARSVKTSLPTGMLAIRDRHSSRLSTWAPDSLCGSVT
jgi:hypothetical protein